MNSTTALNDSAPPPDRSDALDRLRRTIQKVTGAVFYGPLLRSARSAAGANGIGRGGRGESVFQGQLDQILVDRAGEASHHSLNALLFERFAAGALANRRFGEA